MKFELTTCGYHYQEEDAKKLESLGFSMTKQEKPVLRGHAYHKTDCFDVQSIEINTLGELIEFSDKWGSLVFHPDSIEIYDDYRE